MERSTYANIIPHFTTFCICKCFSFEIIVLNTFPCHILLPSRSLPNHKLSGPLSPELGKLDQLQYLYVVQWNFFVILLSCYYYMFFFLCWIVSALADAVYNGLYVFRTLHNNNFYGEIPSELGNCTELLGV